MARSRRGMARLARSRPERWWVVGIQPAQGVKPRRAPVHAPWSRRMRWSPERGLSGTLPRRLGSLVIDAPDIDCLAAFARDPETVARVRRVRFQIGAWRAPTPGWVGRLGPITGLTRAEVRVPHIGPARVRVSLDLTHPRPIREAVAAVLDLLMPGSSHALSPESDAGREWWPAGLAADSGRRRQPLPWLGVHVRRGRHSGGRGQRHQAPIRTTRHPTGPPRMPRWSCLAARRRASVSRRYRRWP